MPIVNIKLYRYVGGTHDMAIGVDRLIRVMSVETVSKKALNKERAKQILTRTFPENGKTWFMWEHPEGWLDHIRVNGEEVWALICKE